MRQRFGITGCLFLLLAGCGPADAPKGLVPVSGTITIDGKAIRDGTVSFISQDEPDSVYSGNITQGKYKVYYSRSAPGVKPGAYLICLTSEDTGSGAPNDESAAGTSPPKKETRTRKQDRLLLDPKYNNPTTSGLAVDVPEKGGTFDFDLKPR